MAELKSEKSKAEGTPKAKMTEEAVYTVDEFVAAAPNIFKNVRTECIVAAFRMAGVQDATVREAQRIVNDFCKKEVK